VFGIFFFRTSIADWNHVPSGSMEPTLFDGDWLLVSKMTYGPSIPFTNFRIWTNGSPHRGDVITFYPPHTDDLYVKRVIGTPGDHIRVQGDEVYVNGSPLAFRELKAAGDVHVGQEKIGKRAHLVQISGGGEQPVLDEEIVVPENHYFVMGDHRNHSADSRYWGFVDGDRVIGKVTYVAISISAKRPLFSRFAVPVR
jgi:signal peptidase I